MLESYLIREKFTPTWNIYIYIHTHTFQNAFLETLHIWLASMFIYYRYYSTATTLIKLNTMSQSRKRLAFHFVKHILKWKIFYIKVVPSNDIRYFVFCNEPIPFVHWDAFKKVRLETDLKWPIWKR